MTALCATRAGIPPRIFSEGVSDRGFLGVSALLFAMGATLTILWCGSMSSMDGMPMPGGWTMSMAWMRMPGQTRLSAAASFAGMWAVMMVAMMMPSLAPALQRYRDVIRGTAETQLGWLTALVGSGYFFIWTVFGMAAYALGIAVTTMEMHQPAAARATPIAIGLIVLIAGAYQFTAWKAHYLACCRETPGPTHMLLADAGSAWRYGLRLGLHCACSCAGLTLVLLVFGVMDLRAMVLATAAITAERLAPAGERVARVTGGLLIGTGLFVIARAAVL
jgi:predicted metal-binding membrane protein